MVVRDVAVAAVVGVEAGPEDEPEPVAEPAVATCCSQQEQEELFQAMEESRLTRWCPAH